METPTPNRLGRNVVFVALVVVLLGVLIGIRVGSGVDDDSSSAPSDTETSPPRAPPEPPAVSTPTPPPVEPKPKPIDIAFAEYAEQIQAVRGNDLASDELKRRVEGRHILWQGFVRAIHRYETEFRVSISPVRTYSRVSAQVTFDLSFEDELSGFNWVETHRPWDPHRPLDHVLFEGIVKLAPNSVSVYVDGLAIEVIE